MTMDVTALQPRTDQLAAQLRRAAPARVQAHRAAFTQLLDTGRDRDNPLPAEKTRATDGHASRQARSPDRPEEFLRRSEIDSRADSEPRESAFAGTPRHETRETAASTDHGSEARLAPREKPAPVGRAEPRAHPAAGAGATDGHEPGAAAASSAPAAAPGKAEVPAHLLMAPAVPSAGAQPATPASGAAAAQPAEPATPATPATLAQPATPAQPAQTAGLALGGTAEDSAVPTLIAPLAEPSIAGPGAAGAANVPSSADRGAATVVTALATALVGKATARGQNQALAAGSAPAGAGAAAAAPVAAQATSPKSSEAQPVTRPAALPEGARSSGPGASNAADPGAAAAGKAAHPALLLLAQEDGPAPVVRITTTPRGDDQGLGKASAPNGPVTATDAHVQPQSNVATPTPGAPQAPDQANLAQAAGPQGQAAQPHTPPPAQALAAARAPADAAPTAFDAGKGGFDPLAEMGGPTAGSGAGSSQNTARAEAARMHRPPMPHTPVAEQVAVRLGKAIAEGADRIDIRLKPAALGSVRISMEVTHDGRVQAVVMADRADTLDMLKQDARSLERALHDAGLKADSNSLSFNLRGGDHRHPEPGNGEGGQRLARAAGPSSDGADAGANAAPAYVGRVGLLDIRV